MKKNGPSQNLKPVADGEGDGIGLETIDAIPKRTILDVAMRTVGVLVGELPGKTIARLTDTSADNVPVRIRNERIEAFVRDGVFAIDIASAHRKSAGQLTSDPEFVKEAGFPIEGQGNIAGTLM